MSTVSNVTQPGIWDRATQVANSAAEWVRSQNFSATAGNLWERVTDAASAAFEFLKNHLGAFYDAAKTAFSNAKDSFAALPLESKVVAGIALGFTTVVGLIAGKVWGGSCTKTEECKKEGDNKEVKNENKDDKKPEEKKA